MIKQFLKKKVIVDKSFCVACGVCTQVCPLDAISIDKGINAKININKCVGCGKCAK